MTWIQNNNTWQDDCKQGPPDCFSWAKQLAYTRAQGSPSAVFPRDAPVRNSQNTKCAHSKNIVPGQNRQAPGKNLVSQIIRLKNWVDPAPTYERLYIVYQGPPRFTINLILKLKLKHCGIRRPIRDWNISGRKTETCIPSWRYRAIMHKGDFWFCSCWNDLHKKCLNNQLILE